MKPPSDSLPRRRPFARDNVTDPRRGRLSQVALYGNSWAGALVEP